MTWERLKIITAAYKRLINWIFNFIWPKFLSQYILALQYKDFNKEIIKTVSKISITYCHVNVVQPKETRRTFNLILACIPEVTQWGYVTSRKEKKYLHFWTVGLSNSASDRIDTPANHAIVSTYNMLSRWPIVKKNLLKRLVIIKFFKCKIQCVPNNQ